jgi:hypothetical protein
MACGIFGSLGGWQHATFSFTLSQRARGNCICFFTKNLCGRLCTSKYQSFELSTMSRRSPFPPCPLPTDETAFPPLNHATQPASPGSKGISRPSRNAWQAIRSPSTRTQPLARPTEAVSRSSPNVNIWSRSDHDQWTLMSVPTSTSAAATAASPTLCFDNDQSTRDDFWNTTGASWAWELYLDYEVSGDHNLSESDSLFLDLADEYDRQTPSCSRAQPRKSKILRLTPKCTLQRKRAAAAKVCPFDCLLTRAQEVYHMFVQFRCRRDG